MTHPNPWKLTTLLLTTVLGAVAARASISSAAADEQPRMHQAVEALKQAEGQLANASDDKGGHRVKALKLTRAAIEEVKKGIAFDNKNDGDKKDDR